MSEQDKDKDFLARWSQRKRDVAATDKAAKKPDVAPAVKTDEASPPAFDIKNLPSIESIGADTDIRAFLQPGVPAELRAAALRRAWVADPAIRNFAGLQEYDFVFNSPETFGMGELPAGTDVARLLTEVFGKQSVAEEPKSAVQEADTQASAGAKQQPADEVTASLQAPDDAMPDDPHDAGAPNAAQQQEQPDEPKAKSRRHGGALPRS